MSRGTRGRRRQKLSRMKLISPAQFIRSIRKRAVGGVVRYRRLAMNSLLVYLDCRPGDESGFSIWLEPTWQVLGPLHVLAGSRQAQVEGKKELTNIGKVIDAILGRRLVGFTIARRSNELTLRLTGEFEIRNFVSDANDDHIWHIDDHEKRLALYASPTELEVVERSRNKPASRKRLASPSQSPRARSH